MSERNTILRSMHDLGVAAWFGGSLMGAVGLNGAASDVADPAERARVSAAGWARWAPVQAAAIGVHAIGGLGLILANKGRVGAQAGVGANTVVKAALTVAAAGTSLYSGVLGGKIAQAGQPHVEAATTPSPETPGDVSAAQKQLSMLPVGHPGTHRHHHHPRSPTGRAATSHPNPAWSRRESRLRLPRATLAQCLIEVPGGVRQI